MRSYLAANCSPCHASRNQASLFDIRLEIPLSTAGLIDGILRNYFGDTNQRVIARGNFENSMLYRRMSTPGPLQMPPGPHWQADTQALSMIREWINELAQYRTFPEWQIANFGSTTSSVAHASVDPDGDRASNYQEYLTRSKPLTPETPWQVDAGLNGLLTLNYHHFANVGIELLWRTNLTSGSWTVLNEPAHPFFISQTNQDRTIFLNPTSPSTFYRLRMFEP